MLRARDEGDRAPVRSGDAAPLEALRATGASRIAVACPFCYVMFDDGVKGEGKDEEVRVQDIAELLWEAIENGAPTAGSTFTPGI